ncbi:MAG: hypothetical protein QM490_04445 [Candidatus Gracilibacteria bacterium]
MENLFFIKIEIFIFISSFLYIIYYLSIRLYPTYFKVKKNTKSRNIPAEKTTLNKVHLNSKNKDTNSIKKTKTKVSEEDKQKIADILKRVKVNSGKGYFDTARNLIVEGLSLDKRNRELNLELASIYEKEHNYINAEYIYKDLLEVLKLDFEVMKKLGYIFAMQNKLKESLKIYEQIHNKKQSDDEVIDLLSELTYNMKTYKKALKYVNLFLVGKPRNVDKLFMKAKTLRELGRVEESKIAYRRILDLQPYNTRAKESIAKIKAKEISKEKSKDKSKDKQKNK